MRNKGFPYLAPKETCTGCGLCEDVCTHQAITIKLNKNGFLEPNINVNLCVSCHLCSKSCPIIENTKLPHRDISDAQCFASWSLNPNIRYNSASGGTFSQVAIDFISKNDLAVVIGASLYPNNYVKHIAIFKQEDLVLLQNSKYAQSHTKGIYIETLNLLKKGYSVLFSGTPCQIAAIYSYVSNKNYTGTLYTIEVICHGVPSQLYSDIATQNAKALYIKSYRTKLYGGENKSQRLTFETDKQHESKSNATTNQNFFYKAFFSDTGLRKSCYTCIFSHLPRIADITLGDYWGIKNHSEERNKGINLMIINSKMGQQIINNTSDLCIKTTSWEECLPNNPNIFTPIKPNKDISISNYIYRINKYLPAFLSQNIFALQGSIWKFDQFILRGYIEYINHKKKRNEDFINNEYKKIIDLIYKNEK